MNSLFFISRKYFLSKISLKELRFVNIVSIISVIGLILATAALVIVLSVFNGLEDLIRGLYHSFDPDLKIESVEGKFFSADQILMQKIAANKNIVHINKVVEDNMLLKYQGKQVVVKMKGVQNDFTLQYPLDQKIAEGKVLLQDNLYNYGIVGQGIQYRLGIDLKNNIYPLEIWYPKASQKNIPLNPMDAFKTASVLPIGVFAIEKQYDDNYIFVPLEVAEKLTETFQKASYLELKLKNKSEITQVKYDLGQILGSNFKILTSDEQHVSMLRAIKIEKLFVYITFGFIAAIASLNLFFMLTLLVLEKKKDRFILSAFGATAINQSTIYFGVAIYVCLLGSVLGSVLGLGICLLQQHFGLISMGMESSLVDAYPVRIVWTDIVQVIILIWICGLLAALKPAINAGNTIES